MIFLELVTLIKKAALEAIENSKPVKVCFGLVVAVDPLEVKIDQKLIVENEHLLFLDGNPALQVEQSIVLLRTQGGQKYVVLGKLGVDG